MVYQRTTHDVWVLEANYGYGDGWEEVLCEYSATDIKKRLQEYQENIPQYPYRVKKKREKIQEEK